MNLAAVLFLFIMSSVSMADYYSAPLKTVQWDIKTSSTLCQLKQKIPAYGEAVFTHQTGELLRFSIIDNRLNPEIIKASLTVESPSWDHDTFFSKDYPVSIDKPVNSHNYSRLSVYGTAAETMLMILTKGLFPRFDYINSSVDMPFSTTQVSISAVNFTKKYLKFIDCRKNFLPHDFKDQFNNSLFFRPGSRQFNSETLQQLKQAAKYIKAVKGSKVVISSDTASVGKRDKKWFLKRAGLIVDRLNKLGVSKSRIKINAKAVKASNNKTIQLKVFGPDALRVIYYRKGNINLTQNEMLRLDLMARYMKAFLPNGNVVIKSYTDSKGSRANNLKVSKNRASVIKKYLVSQGISEQNIKIKAFGERKPAKSNRFPTGRAQNRRVIIDLVG